MFRRIIAIFTLILVIVPFQAFAATGVDPLAVDLLTTDQINYQWGTYTGGISYAGSDVWTGYTMFSGRNLLQFDWTPANKGKFNKVIFTFYFAQGSSTSNSSTWGINALEYRYNEANGYASATRIGKFGSINTSAGCYEQWMISDLRGIDIIDIRVRFLSNLYGGFDIVDVTGFRDVGEPVTSVNCYSKSYYADSNGILKIQNNVSLNGQGVILPKAYYHISETLPRWYYDNLYIDIPAGNRVLKYYDSIVYNIQIAAPYSTAKEYNMVDTTYWNEKVTFSLYETNASNAFISIKPDIACSMNYSGATVGDYAAHPEVCLINLTVSVDVSNYDLSSYTPDLSLQIPPFLDTGGTVYICYAVINDITLIPPIQEKAWYQVFWGWISNTWNNTTLAIGGFIDNAASSIGGFIDNATSSIGGFFSSWSSTFSSWWTSAKSSFGSWFNSVVSSIGSVGSNVIIWGQNIVAALSPSEPALPEVEDQLATAASEFHDEMDIIDSVTVPSADPDDLIDEVFTIVPLDDPSGNAILTGLVDFEAFIPMAIVVLTFSIVGLVFFGKRS